MLKPTVKCFCFLPAGLLDCELINYTVELAECNNFPFDTDSLI